MFKMIKKLFGKAPKEVEEPKTIGDLIRSQVDEAKWHGAFVDFMYREQRVNSIKAMRGGTGLGLKEAKLLTDFFFERHAGSTIGQTEMLDLFSVFMSDETDYILNPIAAEDCA